MLSGPWKQRLIRYANTGTNLKLPMRDSVGLTRTILGRKIIQRKNMNPSFSFQNKIKGEVKYNEIMSKYTSMRIGGPADVFVWPASLKDLQIILKHRGSCPVNATALRDNDQGRCPPTTVAPRRSPWLWSPGGPHLPVRRRTRQSSRTGPAQWDSRRGPQSRRVRYR